MPEQIKRERGMRLILFAAALLTFSFTASAISVKLTADRNGTYVDENMTLITILENESVKFQIQVYEGTKTSSGAFTISKETAANTYTLVGKPHYAYAACLCTGARDMPDLNDEYTFIPLSPGKYRAEALYGGVSRKMDVTVVGISQGASSTTTLETKSTSTSSSTTSSTAQSTTSSSTTLEEPPTTTLSIISSTTTTFLEEPNTKEFSFPWMPALLGLGIVFSFFLFVLKKGGRTK